MPTEQRTDDEVIRRFHRWVASGSAHSVGCHGIDSDISTPFIPDSQLRSYFCNVECVHDLLKAIYQEDDVEKLAHKIFDNYLRAFSILLCIGRGRFIKHFVRHCDLADKRLPFISAPSDWPLSTDKNMWESFQDKQWLFCPQDFELDMLEEIWHDRCILPITEKEILAENRWASIHKVVLEPEYNHLLSDTGGVSVC